MICRWLVTLVGTPKKTMTNERDNMQMTEKCLILHSWIHPLVVGPLAEDLVEDLDSLLATASELVN